jgi:uncharacterized membrane protein YidH (DUF202 family)
MDNELKLQFVDTFAKLITAAFAMVAALAWNEAIKQLISEFFKSDGQLLGLFVYAIIVTIIAVVAVVYITRSFAKLQKMVSSENKDG